MEAETLDIGEARIGGACAIEEEVASTDNIEDFVAMDKSSASGDAETFPTPILDTLAVVPESRRDTEET